MLITVIFLVLLTDLFYFIFKVKRVRIIRDNIYFSLKRKCGIYPGQELSKWFLYLIKAPLYPYSFIKWKILDFSVYEGDLKNDLFEKDSITIKEKTFTLDDLGL